MRVGSLRIARLPEFFEWGVLYRSADRLSEKTAVVHNYFQKNSNQFSCHSQNIQRVAWRLLRKKSSQLERN